MKIIDMTKKMFMVWGIISLIIVVFLGITSLAGADENKNGETKENQIKVENISVPSNRVEDEAMQARLQQAVYDYTIDSGLQSMNDITGRGNMDMLYYEGDIYKTITEWFSENGITWEQTLVLHDTGQDFEVLSNIMINTDMELFTEEEGEARSVEKGVKPYETYWETEQREQEYPVSQWESQRKVELIDAAALYIEKTFPNTKYGYRMAVLPSKNGGGGAVDVEWYIGGEYQGTSFLRFSQSNIDSLEYHKGFVPEF